MEKWERLLKEEEEEESKFIGKMNKQGALYSGMTAAGIARIHADYLEKKLLAFIESVKELIDLRTVNPTPEWKARIQQEFEHHLEAIEIPPFTVLEFRGYVEMVRGKISDAIPEIKARIRRRFDLMFFDEGEKAKVDRTGPITIDTINVTGILNFDNITGDINQSINQVENAGSQQIADILKEIALAVLADPKLEGQARQDAIENIRTIAQEAALEPQRRKLGTVKAALAYIPSLLSAATDVLNYFKIHVDEIRRFFGIQS
jgi:hypothetical protein